MPLFITPMMKAPTTAPITVPTPPAIEAPPMKTAAITSSSNPTPALGVALFSRRGSTASVIAALIAGFAVTLVQQSYVVDLLGLPLAWKTLAFPWQLCIGTSIATLVCLMGQQRKIECEIASL